VLGSTAVDMAGRDERRSGRSRAMADNRPAAQWRRGSTPTRSC
jgi:hypothetical protein